MASSVLPAAHSLDGLAGPPLVGYFFSWALLGVLNVQIYLYYVKFQKDHTFLQVLVYAILALEWIQTILLTVDAFDSFVYHYGDPAALTSTNRPGWFSLPLLCGLVSTPVQCYFAWRIWKLFRTVILCGILVFFSIVQLIFGIITVTGVQLRDVSTTSEIGLSRTALAVDCIFLGGSALVDAIIAVAMTILLLRLKNGMLKTDMMINKVIRFGVESGILTASVAIIGLVLAMGCPGKLYYEPVIYILSKLYANTFITNLLNRTMDRTNSGSAIRNTSWARDTMQIDVEMAGNGIPPGKTAR
ncbi:uncharacterized protein B0H18DRAFT_681518 [Fomitopsis serialis]|uniref:uncharacterized protein n=1 Tax=Fomitopsis serialis TaxID=139415 RepID=UPI0020087EAE|nr:uncharacterized protein B0H18DRAFT_681518 [Neoantrodia serialis]KAH9918047.1 hypothetical protein B0H18DRAFT_681518 [Neoantrodia serialis]